jgi:energy-coupling factor transporter ATP-binding protein EcfA2
VIELRDLYYRYASSGAGWVLEDVNLRIERGEYVLFCGASGSGKSTLCRLLNGLIPHFYGGQMEGQVRVDGLDTREHPVSELFGRVGMIFQNPTVQLLNRTVERELAYGLESLGLPRGEMARRVRESAETVGITHLLERDPHQLSGGEQQLTAIAAVLALHPRVIVLDEPYASLDPSNVRRVREALRRIHGRVQDPPSIVLAEHRLEHVAPDADRIVVLHQGRVAVNGPPRQVLARDLAAYGLNVPPVARAGRAFGLSPLPLTVEEWRAAVDGRDETAKADRLERALEGSPCRGPLRPAPGGYPPGAEPAIEVKGITFGHNRRTPVLRGVDLSVYPGESLAVVGANGSGKTTLIKHLNGLYRPQQGRVWVLGQDTRRARVSELARHVGMAFQNANDQFFKFRVRDEIEVGARALGRYDAGWMEELIALFDLEPLLERSPYKLSEGQKKRVAFAAALAARPETLVLDEPTTGQDWPFRRALGDLLGALRARTRTVLLVTHDLEFAERCASRWALMADGQVVASGAPEEVMAGENAMGRAGLEPTQTYRLRRAWEGAVG